MTLQEGVGARVPTPRSSLPLRGSPLAEWPENPDVESPGMKSIQVTPWREQEKEVCIAETWGKEGANGRGGH